MRNKKWSISNWDISYFDKKIIPRSIFFLSGMLIISGFLLMFLSVILASKLLLITSFICLFFSIICYVVAEILKESQNINNHSKIVKHKFEKDEFFDD